MLCMHVGVIIILPHPSQSSSPSRDFTFSPTCIGDSPAKGTFPVDSSHRITAKLYMSTARLSISSGLS